MEKVADLDIDLPFLQQQFLGNSILEWLIAAAVLLVIVFGVALIRRLVVKILKRVADSTETDLDDIFVGAISRTNLFFAAVIGLVIASYPLDLPDKVVQIRGYILSVTIILQLAFYANAILQGLLMRARKTRATDDAAGQMAITAIKYVSRVILWSIVLLIILDNVGVNISALIAGLGVGGIAIALAIQSILGDALSFVAIIFDKPFEVGDFLIVDDKLGTVKKVGLKTTRVRALQGEEIVFSNNDLLKSRIRNFKKMQERRIAFMFGVVYQTSAEQLEKIPGYVKEIIDGIENARFDRAHFFKYGAHSLDFEVVYYVKTGDYNEYMDIQQDINMKIFRKFQDEGVSFAYPTQTLYVNQESGSDKSSEEQQAEPSASEKNLTNDQRE